MKVEFFVKASGRSPVIDFIDSQPERDQAVILAVFSNIQENGFNAKGAKFRQLEGKLWEIKVKAPSGGYRFLYVTLERKIVFILHAFMKKTQKAPKKELDIARKRIKEIL